MAVTYTIKTNLPPEAVTRIGMEIYAMWVDFALGQIALNGKRIMHPTGRYASSIQFKREGEATVAVVADEMIAPVADIIEHGHGPVDMKTKLQRGKSYPLHRGARMWAGNARVGDDGWLIPAMVPYAPSLVFSNMMKAMLSEG